MTAALVVGLVVPASAAGAQAAPLSRPGSSDGSIFELNVTNDPTRMHGQPQIAIDPKDPNDRDHRLRCGLGGAKQAAGRC